MNTVGTQIADIQDNVLCGLELDRKAVLDSVRLAVVLGEAYHGERSLKARHEISRVVRVTAG